MNKVTFKVATSPEDILSAQKVRFEVFTEEQGFPRELDLDGDDERSFHVLAYAENNPEPIASGRLTINIDEGVLSRIAVKKQFRGMSLGKQVVMRLEEIAKEKNVRALSLSPHSYLKKFYSDLGYQTQEGTKQISKYTLLKMKKNI